MFLNKNGGQPTTVDDRAFLDLIREIYDGEPKLFGLEATSAGDLLEKFIIFGHSGAVRSLEPGL